MTRTTHLLVGAALAGLASLAAAAPTLLPGSTLLVFDERASQANGAKIGSTAVANVADARADFERRLGDGSVRENFATAPYAVEETGSDFPPFFAAKPITGGLSVLGGRDMSLQSGTHYIDTNLTQPFATGGRYDPTSPDCTGTTQAAIEACTARWFETTGSFLIEFDGEFGAFGFFGTDFGDFRGSLALDLLDANLAVVRTLVFDGFGNSGNGALGFFGFVDSQVRYSAVKLTVRQTEASNDYFGFDDLILGQARSTDPDPNPVPEPGSLALVGASLLALTAARRRRKA